MKEDLDLYYNETPSSDVQERDVDLLIAEELSSSISFVRWFCEQVYGPIQDKFPLDLTGVDVRHSCLHIGDGYGESDIVLRIKDQFMRYHIFLIEDKINASFTPNQPDRYRKRLESIIRTDQLADGRTVLVAPKSFLDRRADQSDFDAKISYESLIDYFDARSKSIEIEELSMRYIYRRDLLSRAIRKKGHIGPVVNPDPRVCDFREQYAELVRDLAPELKLGSLTRVKEPNEWVRFPEALSDQTKPARFLLVHKPYGRASLQINSDADGIGLYMERIKGLLASEQDMSLSPSKKSFSISIDTPKIDMRKPLSDQAENVANSVAVLLRLRSWFESNSGAIIDILATR